MTIYALEPWTQRCLACRQVGLDLHTLAGVVAPTAPLVLAGDPAEVAFWRRRLKALGYNNVTVEIRTDENQDRAGDA